MSMRRRVQHIGRHLLEPVVGLEVRLARQLAVTATPSLEAATVAAVGLKHDWFERSLVVTREKGTSRRCTYGRFIGHRS